MGPRRTALALVLAALAACGDPARSASEVDRGLVQLATDKVAVKIGPVGEERWRSQASYALVEARNSGAQDLMVTLGGELVDAAGQGSWPLRRESLRVPAGGTRLFALVDDGRAERQAKSARVEVVGAVAVGYQPPFVITDGRVVMDEDRAVAAGYVVNTAERPGSVAVIGAFFDEAGAPLKRTSTVFALAAEGRRGVQLVGPPGSRSAYLFVGDVNY
jgi:hypothetical protein